MNKNVPEELKSKKQWVCYKAKPRGNKITKEPVNPISGYPNDANNEENWLLFEEALHYVGNEKITGIGFVFTNEDDYVGIDIDACVDENGRFNQIANEVLKLFVGKAYAEYSPSGKGIHLIVKGQKSSQRSKNKKLGLEVYSDKRYFTVTGNTIEGYNEIHWCSNEVNVICNKFLEKEENKQQMTLLVEGETYYEPTTEEIIEVMFTKRNGGRLKSLYEGDWESYYHSQSEADLAFCNALAFYTQKNPAKMDDIFRHSGLFRKKWDEIHYADGRTYGNAVIEEAINSAHVTYTPSNLKKSKKETKSKFNTDTKIKLSENELPKWYEKGTNSLNFFPGILAEYISKTQQVIFSNEHFFQYDKGVYRMFEKMQQVKKIIQEHLLIKHSKPKQINDTLELLKNLVLYDGDLFDSQDLKGKINFKNGIFNIQSGILETHSPKILTSVQINANYAESATCPIFMKFINESLSPNDILIAQELMGYLLIPETLAEKSFILFGPGRSGKSTFINIIEFILGKDHCSHVTIQNLSTKFQNATLYGKLANTFADLPSKAIQDTSFFKTLVSGDSIVVEEKGQTPFSFNNKARLLFSCNELPANYVDRTDGFFRRLIILPFLNQVEESKIDTKLLTKLQNEVDGIIQWAIQGLQRLTANGYQFTKSDTTQKLLNDYRKQSNNVIWFVEDYCILSTDASEFSKNLYQNYKRTCLENNMQPISQMKFNRSIEMEYGRNVIRTEDSNRRVIFKGIRISNK